MTLFKRKINTPLLEKSSFPIIIGGCHRSGTTLLRRILDSHSSINCPPEVKFFKDFYGDYLHDELSNVRFFSTAKQMGLSDNELLELFGNAFIKSYVLAAKKRGKIRWADKNPENVLYLNDWWKLLEGNFLFILLIRNPLDTLASIKEVGFTKTLPTGLEELVVYYNRYVEAGLKFVERHEETSLIIQYEDLVNDPESLIKEVMTFVGEKYESSMIKLFNSRKRLIGLEDPKILNTNSIHSDSIGRWKSDLSEREVAYIQKKCNKIFKRFNY